MILVGTKVSRTLRTRRCRSLAVASDVLLEVALSRLRFVDDRGHCGEIQSEQWRRNRSVVEADQSDDRVVCVDHLLTERPLLQHLLGDVGGQNGTVRTFVITDTIATLAVLEEYLHS